MGGLLYSLRPEQGVDRPRYTHYNGRGDVVLQTDQAKQKTYEAAYEAFGTRTRESGSTPDRQRANTKEEETEFGLLNEGFRYRDLETGVWLTRDPAGFVDGPNLYAYVRQNPWTTFDPEGLEAALGYYPDLLTEGERQGMRNFDRGVYRGIANTPRALKETVENIPQLPGAIAYAARNPGQAVANVKATLHETIENPEKLGEAIGTGFVGGFFAKLLTRMRPTTGAVSVTAGSSASATAAQAEVQIAKIVQHEGTPTHFSVQVSKAEPTHQVVTAPDTSSTRIVTTETVPAGPVVGSAAVKLSDAAAAAARQAALLKVKDLGKYHKILNSCVSHVCDVLRAGGANPPAPRGSSQLRYLLDKIKKGSQEGE